MLHFEFDTSNADCSEYIGEFCKEYDDEYDDKKFQITREYLCELDLNNIKSNLMLNLTNMQGNVIGYHIVASVLGMPNDLDMNFSYQLKNLVMEENERLDICGGGLKHHAYTKRFEQIGNSPFVYKKAICNILENTDIGKNLHPFFSKLNLKDPTYVNTVIGATYKTLKKSNWIQCTGMSYGLCTNLSFFYIKEV